MRVLNVRFQLNETHRLAMMIIRSCGPKLKGAERKNDPKRLGGNLVVEILLKVTNKQRKRKGRTRAQQAMTSLVGVEYARVCG